MFMKFALALLAMTDDRTRSVAIVGGGISGACAASELAKAGIPVTLYDQGRRGPGGRASHRSVRAKDQSLILSEDEKAKEQGDVLEFDHGCQFFRADSALMRDHLLPEWLEKGWAAPWKARIGCLSTDGTMKQSSSCDAINDFFGVPSKYDSPVYIGVGGMHRLVQQILANQPPTTLQVHAGTRVCGVRRDATDTKWELLGMKGDAAYHDNTKNDPPIVLGTADTVLFTDISSASDAWHRASAGIPSSLRKCLPEKLRMPLFSCMVALSRPVAKNLPLDAFTVDSSQKLWFCSCSHSKPGMDNTQQQQQQQECWTLISTPAYAVSKIQETAMRDPATGEFRPQTNEYLQSVPGPELFEAFQQQVLLPALGCTKEELPTAVYLQAQRWGSGLPLAPDMAKRVEEIVGDRFVTELAKPLVGDTTETHGTPFVADDELGLYYAGDFCSNFPNPGLEGAALAGVEVARHIGKMHPKQPSG